LDTPKNEVQEVDLSSLEEGDIVVVTTNSGSVFRLEILETPQQFGDNPRVSIQEKKHFPKPTETIRVGSLRAPGQFEVLLKIDRRLAIHASETQALKTSSIKSIEIHPA
jgi:hypothetical protein